MSAKEYDYTNDMGVRKKIIVHPAEKGRYPFSIFEMVHGENTGNGKMTHEELISFLSHYGINIAEFEVNVLNKNEIIVVQPKKPKTIDELKEIQEQLEWVNDGKVIILNNEYVLRNSSKKELKEMFDMMLTYLDELEMVQ